MVLKSAERFYLTLEVDMHSMTVILIKDGKEGRTYDASQYFQYFVEYGVRKADVAQLQEHFSIEYFQNMLVTGEKSEEFEFCVQFVGEDYKILECKMKLGESQNSDVIRIMLEDISHKRVQQLVYIKEHFVQHKDKSYAKLFDVKFEEEKSNKDKKEKSYKYAIIVVSILSIVILITFFRSVYMLHINKAIEDELKLCKSTSQSIEQELNYNFFNLTTFNNLISTIGTKFTNSELIDYAELEKKKSGYDVMIFIDENDDNFDYEKAGGFTVTTDSITGKVFINYILPTEILTTDGVSYKSIMASIDLNKVCNKLFNNRDLRSNEYIIINEEGDILWCGSSELSSNINQKNFLSYLNNSSIKIKPVDGFKSLQKNLVRNKWGTFYYKLNGQIKFVAYVPLEIQDLYLVSLSKPSKVGFNVIKLFIILIVMLIIIIMFPVLSFMYQIKKGKEREKHLEEIAYYDVVTSGMNSNYFNEKAKKIICEKDVSYALVVTNLRNFNLYNSKYGHVRGDELIRRVFLGISKYIDDDELVCRAYAEQMLILMKYENKNKVEDRLIRIGECIIDTSFRLEFGICLIRDLDIDIKEVKERAIMSLKNEAKIQKDNCTISYYDAKFLEKILFEKELENTMYRAFKIGEFKIFVEPRYNLKTRSLCNGDAYAVWDHPEKGILRPQQYMEVFQRRGLDMCLDCYIFEEICKKIKEHIDKGRSYIHISIKLHRNHFNVIDFMDKFVKIKNRYGIPGECFSFEISEQIIYEKLYQIDKIINSIHEMGAICNMGEYKGYYLPLEKLCKIGIDTIKFDSDILIKNLPEEIVVELIKLAKVVNAKTIMTSVSKQSQILYLSNANCDEAKGDVFAKNISLNEYINIF